MNPATAGSGRRRAAAGVRAVVAVFALVLFLAAGWQVWTSDPAAGLLGQPDRWPRLGSADAASAFGGFQLAVFVAFAFAGSTVALERPVGRATGLVPALLTAAALLGASPVSVTILAVVGWLTANARNGGRRTVRLAMAVSVGWSLPVVLRLVGQVGGPAFDGGTLSVLEVATVWLLLIAGVPVMDVVETRLLAAPERHLDVEDVLTANFQVQAVLAALATLLAMTYAALGPISALLLALPVQAARVGFSLHRKGQRAIEQTLASMARLPEWVGAVDHAHAERVANVSLHASLRLGHGSALRRDIELAARLHELGHLDRGAEADDRERISGSGAVVLEQAGVTGRVAGMVRASAHESPASSSTEDVAGAIVATACALDRRRRVTDAVAAGATVAAEVRSRASLNAGGALR